MEQIGVRELRQHASKYLARVEAGEEIEVTNHGRLVARLVPVSEKERRYRELVALGQIIPAKRPLDLEKITAMRKARRPLKPGEKSASQILEEMRNE
ncbi:type II toxin-antitoxin system Phd/YefM family antitoxin [Tsukamurella asaccharolytica]|uniref:Antitoxin n=1 Tax=Tsukamurella asaccharolytica TaxID=2592067 RepID=A0A5C5RF58_9ACTN|nr:type II toxin-antitoxin system Phd/YefM family antitoxin [Tsukamurella asaccharolytica]TWS20725.1 type II toxin-antitoxin system Phd/YefM family antitoxin [Tsukamurella asaccharolytica]